MTTTAVTITDRAWEAIHGGHDLHVHVAPDVIARRIDDLDLAREFLARGLAGFALKSHYFPTAERAAVVTKAVAGIAVRGTISLNHSVGGLNPVAVELAGRSGCKIVWMPTVDAANEVRASHQRAAGEAAILGGDSARAEGDRHQSARDLGPRRERHGDGRRAHVRGTHRASTTWSWPRAILAGAKSSRWSRSRES